MSTLSIHNLGSNNSLDLICANWKNSVFHIQESESHSGGSEGEKSSIFYVEYAKLGLIILCLVHFNTKRAPEKTPR